jgi:hypothetical protein
MNIIKVLLVYGVNKFWILHVKAFILEKPISANNFAYFKFISCVKDLHCVSYIKLQCTVFKHHVLNFEFPIPFSKSIQNRL